MTTSKQALRFDIWLVYLHFTDNPKIGKVRPVLVVDVSEESIFVAKITSQAPRIGFIGEYVIKQWREAGLNVVSTIRCSQIFEIAESELLRDAPIGQLQQADIDDVSEVLKAMGYYKF
jgi:mRNA-degrading endonuclease toxin of MazEF toxin-antitoxin module